MPQVRPVTPQSQRRYSEAVPSSSRSDHSSRSHSTTTGTPRRTNFPQHINTDIPMSSTPQASSSTAPYLELVSTPTPSTPAPNNWDLCVAQENQATRLRIPRHLVVPLTIPDDSYLSRIYTHYLQGAKQMLEQGVHVADVLGSNDEVGVDLFFRERRESDKFDCASWACEVFRSYDTDVFARLGSSYMLTLMMRVSHVLQNECPAADFPLVASGPHARELSEGPGNDEANTISVYGSAYSCDRDHTNPPSTRCRHPPPARLAHASHRLQLERKLAPRNGCCRGAESYDGSNDSDVEIHRTCN